MKAAKRKKPGRSTVGTGTGAVGDDAGTRGHAHEQDDDPDAVGAVIADACFWAYAGMLQLVGGAVQQYQGWMQSCRCHPGKTIMRQSGVASSLAPRPMLGRRAPERANG
eukprot:12040218-Alexandrium_andersonii.AAC.1